VFLPGRHFQEPILEWNTWKKCFTLVGSVQTHKYQTRLEGLTRDKYSSILQKSINYNLKVVYNINLLRKDRSGNTIDLQFYCFG
jgi:hypothetical protein